MATVPTGSSFPVPAADSYPAGEAVNFFSSIGTISGADLNYTAGGISYVVGQAIQATRVDHIEVSHEGITGGAGHSVEVAVYIVPNGISVAAAIYAGDTYRIASAVTTSYASATTGGPGRIQIPLQGEDAAGRTMQRSSRLVVTFRSLSDSGSVGYYTTTIRTVSVAALGLSVLGTYGSR